MDSSALQILQLFCARRQSCESQARHFYKFIRAASGITFYRDPARVTHIACHINIHRHTTLWLRYEFYMSRRDPPGWLSSISAADKQKCRYEKGGAWKWNRSATCDCKWPIRASVFIRCQEQIARAQNRSTHLLKRSSQFRGIFLAILSLAWEWKYISDFRYYIKSNKYKYKSPYKKPIWH